MAKVNLGDRVRDPVTGIQGIAYVRMTYLQGCDRIGIQPPTVREKGKEPKVPDLYHVDEPQLAIVKRKVVKCQENGATAPGGPSYFAKDSKK